MRTHRSIVRPFVLVVCLLAVLGSASQASAKEDWIGWLEELSGPGPFTGYELSFEVACFNVSQKRTVAIEDLRAAFPKLRTSAVEVRDTFDAFDKRAAALAERRTPSDPLQKDLETLRRLMADPADPTLVDPITHRFSTIGEVIASMRAHGLADDPLLQAFDTAHLQQEQVAAQASAAAILGAGPSGVIAQARARSFSRIGSISSPRWSCTKGALTLEEQRVAERQDFSRALAGKPRKDEPLVVNRRDWQTGLVVDFGSYWSQRNHLFDGNPAYTKEPQLRIVPLELLLHSKLSPAIDIGAGLGVAFFHTDFHGGPPPADEPRKLALYGVPLSVVVRPARLVSDSKWASAFGYRVGVRFFGELNGQDFGAPASSFQTRGEFVWGASTFVDLVTLFGL